MRVLQTLIAFSGNAPPQLAVTHELVRRGHDVRVLAHAAARERIERSGATFVSFERTRPDYDLTRRETDAIRDWEARTRFGAQLRVLRNGVLALLADSAHDCAAALRERPADVVLLDWMLPGAAVAAEAADVPSVVLVHCPYPLPLRGVPPQGLGLPLARGPVGAARDRLLAAAGGRVLAAGVPALNATRARHGLDPLRNWDEQALRCAAICMLTAPELDFSSRGAVPANLRWVGPAFEPSPREWTPPWPAQDADPLVLVSFSTSFMDQRALVQRVLDALGELPVRALLTTGPALDAAQLRLPANAHAVAFLPHRAVLPQAALVVTHGGWQTVNAALADGVPLVCVPCGRDQPDNAARVVAAGAGVRVHRRAGVRRLRRTIAAALADPGLGDGARTVARALARSDGAVAVSDALEELVA